MKLSEIRIRFLLPLRRFVADTPTQRTFTYKLRVICSVFEEGLRFDTGLNLYFPALSRPLCLTVEQPS